MSMWKKRLKYLRIALFVSLGIFFLLGSIYSWFAYGPTGMGKLDQLEAELKAQNVQLDAPRKSTARSRPNSPESPIHKNGKPSEEVSLEDRFRILSDDAQNVFLVRDDEVFPGPFQYRFEIQGMNQFVRDG